MKRVLAVGVVVMTLLVGAVALSPAAGAAATAAQRDQAGRIYRSVFHRWPDAVGLAHWSDLAGTGVPPAALAEQMLASPEGLLLYPSLTSGDLVKVVYFHTFDRAPDQAGYDYWAPLIQSGRVTRGRFVAAIADSQESIRLTGTLQPPG
ncbi:MAG: DUF4214 domain-containing protein [Acidimicrobiales bacterium]|nr:DUF4214 domain-containing protein [Acidimicrobiales bacterium]